MSPTLPIVTTKLDMPIQQPGMLDRVRLTDRLAEALRLRLTLIAADAGFGKTTAMAQAVSASGLPMIWYRLDPGDSDPATFTAYVLEGLRSHASRSGLETARRGLSLVTDWTIAAQVLSTVLVRVRGNLLIVLDDLHALASPTLTEGMTRFIEDLPARIHLALLTRVRPTLPLARWLAQGALTEFGPDDLRFTSAELHDLLVGVHGLPLTEASLHLVGAKTEGWPAGIVLALHAVQAGGPAAAAQSLAGISGSSREIYAYLAQEAYARQTVEVQRFLLATSLLSRFSAGLTDRLLGTTGGQRIIDHLEQSHLFLVPLDPERRWYRYHHLFQDFLQRVAAERDPEWLRDIHRGAARLWEADGNLDEALPHLIEGGEPAEAARMLSSSVWELLARGRFDTLRRWLSMIPEQLRAAAPRLFMIEANCAIAAGDHGSAMRVWETARRHLHAAGDLEGEAEALRILGRLLMWEGAPERLRVLAEAAPHLEAFPPAMRPSVLEMLAGAAEMEGDLARAEELYRTALQAAEAHPTPRGPVTPMRYLAGLLGTTGGFAEAISLYEAVIAGYGRIGGTHEEAHVRVNLAVLLASLGKQDEAEIQLSHVAAVLPTVPCRVLEGNLLFARAQLAAGRGRVDVAVSQLRDALDPGRPSYRYLSDRVPSQIVLALLIEAREPDEARRLAAAAGRAGSRLGPVWGARTLLASGVVTASTRQCVEAAEQFSTLGLPHWRALALVSASAVARAQDRSDEPSRRLRREAANALGALQTDEAWAFLAAQAGAARLAAFRSEPEVGTRVSQALLSLAESPVVVTIRCLGRFEVIRHGRPVGAAEWPRSAPRRLLQYLAVQRRPLHREEIMEAFWPGLDPRQAGNRLRVALSQLRAVLEPNRPPDKTGALILTVGPTIALARDRVDVDVDAFQRGLSRARAEQSERRRAALSEAIAMYVGELLPETPYEEWAMVARERLARQYLSALAKLAEEEESAGLWEDAVSRWQTLLDREPEAEHACRGVMRCALALGRVPEALRAFERCRAALTALGASPSPDTLLLHKRLTAATA